MVDGRDGGDVLFDEEGGGVHAFIFGTNLPIFFAFD